MNKLLKCVNCKPNLEHNISVNTSKRKKLKTHDTIHRSINKLVHKISAEDLALLTINIPVIQNTTCSPENKTGISCHD